MRIKLRVLTIFIATFVAVFGVLNSRFVLANVRFWMLTGTSPSTFSAPINTQAPPPVSQGPKERPLSNSATLVIEKLGMSAPLVFGSGDDPGMIYKDLEKGVVHYSNTPKPGQNGVSVVLGHSSAYPWYKGNYGSVFALLGKLDPGDRFYVQYDDGRRFDYAVKQSIVFKPLVDDPRLTEIENNPDSSLVLVSCWPVGTDYKRIAVQAELM